MRHQLSALCFVTSFVLLSPLTTSTSPIDASEAKANADTATAESALSPDQARRLVKAQGTLDGPVSVSPASTA